MKKDINEMIAIMQAFADGKEIQQGDDKYGWFTSHTPSWDWSACDYRIKPEPPKQKIVPYESAEEFLAAMKEHGPYLSDKNNNFTLPTNISNWGLPPMDYYGEMDWEELLEQNLTWQDGTLCGKEVVE